MGRNRQSSFELLRIISMLLVLVTHVNFNSLGWPNPHVFSADPTGTIGKLFFESTSICCVNVFVMISGWFGIKPSVSKLFHLIFQCFFFSFGLLLVAVLLENNQVGPLFGEIKKSFFLRDYWFITSYILLFILAPVLNAFVENANKRTHCFIICSFFLYQTIYGWLISANGINSGYSTISFIGIYLLVQYIKRYPIRVTQQRAFVYFLVFLACCVLNTLICMVILENGRGVQRFFFYTNPLILLSSVSLILAFSKMDIQSNVINFIASSALSVYLFHQNHFVMVGFKRVALKIYLENESLLYFFKISLFIMAVFAVSVMIDQIRKFLERLIFKPSC